MQQEIDIFNLAFVQMATGYVKRVAERTLKEEPEARGAAQQFRLELADEVSLANLLAVTVGKLWDKMAQEPPQDSTEPVKLGPGAAFKMGSAEPADALLALKELCRYSRSREDGGDYRWKRYTTALEFAVSILSELREIKEVRVSAEPNAPEAAAGKDTAQGVEADMRDTWEAIADILTGRKEAPEGCVINLNVNVEDTAQEVTTFPVGSVTDKPQEEN